MGNSSLYQLAFKGRWKFLQVKAIENVAISYLLKYKSECAKNAEFF